MRSRRFAAVLAVAALVLTGCAVATDTSWTPTGFGDDPLVRPAAAPEMLDATTVAGLVPLRVRNDAVGVQARIALLPGAAPANEVFLGAVHAAIGAASAASAVAYTPQVSPPGAGLGERGCVRGSTQRPASELLADPALGAPAGTGTALACDIVAATGTVLGQRVRIVSGSPAGVTADTTVVAYADLASGAVVSASELWTPEAPAALWTGLVEMLRRDAGALSLAPVDPPDEAALAAFVPALASTVPGADGSLVFTVPPGFVAPALTALGAPPTADALTVGVSPTRTAGLVTPVGAALVAAASGGAPYQAPAPVAAGDEPVDCALVPCIAITYDDGPGELTPGILDALAAHHGAATFFVMGSKASAYADVLRRAIAEGHEVENHSWDHPHLPDIPLAKAKAQLVDTTAAIEAVTGVRVTMFRPPYGDYDAAVVNAAGLPAVLWDVDTFDWQGPPDDELVRRAVEQPRPGSIVLQHDIQAVTARTAAAVYDGLADRGFRLVTVTQLFGGEMPASGVWRRLG